METVQSNKPLAQLNGLYNDYWEYVLREYPTLATYFGDHRYDGALEDISPEAYDKRVSETRSFLGRLRSYSKPASGTDRLNYELFERDLSDQIEEAGFRPWLTPITQQLGPHIELPQLTTYHPFRSVEDFENYVTRLRKIPRLMEQATASMKMGITEKLVQPKVVVEKIIPQLDAHIVKDPVKSEFYKPITTASKEVAPEDSRKLREEFEDAVMGFVVPAYEKLKDFVLREYLPASRKDVGVWALPDGKERYAFYVRLRTTTSLSPDQIHEMGFRELSRIHSEMREIMLKVDFSGTLQEFIESVRGGQENYYPTREALLNGFKEILKKMDVKLPALFGRLPKAPYGFREIEDYRADAAPDAYYYPPPEDGSRPAYFYVNTYKPETRPKHTMEALAYHEAVPGHHLQLAIQQELIHLPKFRRFGGYVSGGYTAFVEGWALYSERLPKEVGFYTDAYSDFGRLTMDAWRATRLVVDTGIHHKHWTREEAIQFFKKNTSLSEQNIVSEVDRYIVTPGQALAYKIGQLKILEIRSHAEKLLGPRFDIRAFHDELLNDGALSLDVLETKMERWLETQTRVGL